MPKYKIDIVFDKVKLMEVINEDVAYQGTYAVLTPYLNDALIDAVKSSIEGRVIELFEETKAQNVDLFKIADRAYKYNKNDWQKFLKGLGDIDNYINKYNCNYTDRYNVISECNGNSYCNGTGVYCTSSYFFTGCTFDSSGSMSSSTGCTYRTAAWAGATAYTYAFAGCDSGYYRSPSGTGISACQFGASGYTSYTVFANCCERCPSYSGTPNGGSTNTGNNYWSSNCASGWCWVANTGIGISNCKIYPDPSGKSYSDTAGTYTLPNGCPYVQ